MPRRPTGRPRPATAARTSAHDVVVLTVVLHEHVERRPERRDARHVAFGEPRRKPIEEEVDRTRQLPGGRGVPGGHRHRLRADARAETPGIDRRADRLEVRLARRFDVERPEPPRRIEQQRRSITPPSEHEHDLRTQSGEPRALERVQRAAFRRGQKHLRRLRRT